MPSWITHIATANSISERINIKDESEFLFANVAPDILEGHIITDISKKMPYEITHFAKVVERNGIIVPLPDIEKFRKMYKSKLKNTFILGYYTHLLTDYFWNDYCYTNYFSMYDKTKNLIKVKQLDGSEKIETWHESVAEKQKDFRIFTKYLQKKININDNFDEGKLLEDCKEFSITKSDISNTVNYLKNIKNIEIEQEDYTIFSEEVLKQTFNDSVDFIVEKIVEEV